MTIQTVSNKFGVAKWIVDPVLGKGTHTTITAAYASSSSGETIEVRPGTYTENPTVKPGTNLVAYNGDQLNPNVTIVGTCTMTGAGTSSISNIRLQTNSAAAVAVTGSAASILNLNDCYLDFTNNTGITYSSSSSSAKLSLSNCQGNLGTTGIAYFAHSSAGNLSFRNCNLTNTGLSTTASTISSGTLVLIYARFIAPITTSSTAIITFEYSSIQCASLNVSALTHNSTSASSSSCQACYFNSGTAATITLGLGSNLALINSSIATGNANAVTETGAATLSYTSLDFQQAGSGINVTTQANLNSGPVAVIGGTNAGTDNILLVNNASNTSNSRAYVKARVNGTAAGDCYHALSVGSTRSYAMGLDNSDSQRFKITTAASNVVDPSSGTTVLTCDATNIWVTGLSFDSGSNVISNYAVGTFTPTMIGTVAGTTTYTVQQGYYTRLGNTVTVWGNVQGSAATGTGAVVLGGLPFTIKNQTGYAVIGTLLMSNAAAWVYPAGGTSLTMNGAVNTTNAGVFVSGSAAGGGALQMANAVFAFQYCLTYQI